MKSAYIIPVILFLLGLALRAVYELLKEARKIDPENRAVLVLISGFMFMLWASWFSLCPEDPLWVHLPVAVKFSGLALLIPGIVLAAGALLQLRGVENIDHLVTTGLFKKIRHPMYAGFILWIIGWSLFHGALLSLAVGIPGILSVLWWRSLEDRRLGVQFGGAYAEYRRTTWF